MGNRNNFDEQREEMVELKSSNVAHRIISGPIARYCIKLRPVVGIKISHFFLHGYRTKRIRQ